VEQGREVFAVPGSPLDPRAKGANPGRPNLTEGADDVFAVLRPMLGQAFHEPQEPRGSAPPADEIALEREADRVRMLVEEKLGPAPVEVDELSRQCGAPPAAVLTVLLELELAGRLQRYGKPRSAGAELAPRAKEFPQEVPGPLRIFGPFDVRPVMTSDLRKEARTVFDRTAFWIGGGVDKPLYAREADGAGAHGTRFQRHIEGGPDKPLVAEQPRSFPYGQNFGVHRRIVHFDDPIPCPSEQIAVCRHKHRTDRHFPAFAGQFGFVQRHAHMVNVLLFHGPQDTRKP
jgi:hypothetical protein